MLEALESFGGTWLTHRYPGIRSDSDLYTFGYRFKPWTGTPIATAEEILKYMGEVIEENDLARHIRYRHRIASATLVERGQSLDHRGASAPTPASRSASRRTSCGCARATTAIPRATRRSGRAWPTSRAASSTRRPGPRTSTTRARRWSSSARARRRRRWCPAIADDCAHVTMLQRSPTYFMPGAQRQRARRHSCASSRSTKRGSTRSCAARSCTTRRCSPSARSTSPSDVREELLAGVRAYLGPDYDVATHFTPTLPPVAAAHRLRARRRPVPAHRSGQGVGRHRRDRALHREGHPAQVGQGARRPTSSSPPPGFNINVLGDIAFAIDGKPLDFADTVTYRGMMFTGMPNMVWVFGYFRASWTLRADLLADFVCRLLDHMKEKRRAQGRGGAAARGRGHAAPALDRPGELQSRLSDARHAPAAQARRQAGVAAHPGLLAPRRTRSRRSISTTRRSSINRAP